MRRFLILMASVPLIGGCDLESTLPDPQLEWFTLLSAAPGWEHLSGEAAMVWTQGNTDFAAAAVIVDDEPGAVRPWHVHHNTCEEGGGIVGADGDYPRLMVTMAGTASAVASVPIPIDPDASYHVNVHLSEAEMETIIACGDLVQIAGPQ